MRSCSGAWALVSVGKPRNNVKPNAKMTNLSDILFLLVLLMAILPIRLLDLPNNCKNALR